MSKYKWTFAKQGGDNRGNHSEDVSIKLFRDYTNRCLIREFAQNFIDAPSNAPNAEPVEIHLSYMQLDDDVKEQMVDSLYERMVACKRENDRTGNSKNAYINKVQFLDLCKDRKVTCLKISDYNTTGMDYYDENLWDLGVLSCTQQKICTNLFCWIKQMVGNGMFNGVWNMETAG